MAFRRSFAKAEENDIRRKAIMLTGSIVFLFILIKFGVDALNRPIPMHYISVQMQDRSTFIIEQDTTNYDQFASILKERVIDARENHPYFKIKIVLKLPKVESAAEIADVIQVVDAMDVPFVVQYQ